jgi:putative spermidine/putrescine transport system permease protein
MIAAQSRSGLLRVTLALALIVSAALIGALLNIFAYSVRTYIPGSLQVGGFTLANFGRLLNPTYVAVFADTLILSFAAALLTLIASFPLAYALVRVRSGGLKLILFLVVITPLFTGDITRTYAWTVMLGERGFLNFALLALHVTGQPLQLLYTRLGVVIVLTQYAMPVMTMVIAAALKHVGEKYERAAATLGATGLQTMIRIVLPLAAPGLTSGLILVFAWNLSAFATPQLIGGGRIPMIANLVYNEGLLSFDLPIAGAMSLLALALALTVIEISRLCLRRLEGRVLS